MHCMRAPKLNTISEISTAFLSVCLFVLVVSHTDKNLGHAGC